jgi:hypothetical protein
MHDTGAPMLQRVPRRTWRSPSADTGRPRVLIEDGHEALAISDFSLFERAGLDIAFCSGPGADPPACPLLRGEPCPLVDRAEAVLHCLDPALGIAAAVRRECPGLPVVVERRRRPGGPQPVLDGCAHLPYPSSVRGQIDAVWRALADRRR